MIRYLQNVGLLTASTALSIALIDINPVQAASFEFTLGDYGEGNGGLYFNFSPLKGIGTEKISFSQLYQYWIDHNASGSFDSPEFYYSYSTVLGFSESPEVNFYGSGEDAIFTFSSGELVEIKFDNIDRENFSSYDGRYGEIYSSYGFAYFSFKGARTEILLSKVNKIIGGGWYFHPANLDKLAILP